jgi:RHS repeat-associated protein
LTEGRFGYTPYGETAATGENGTSATAVAERNANQYTAKENDGVGAAQAGLTGLYYYRARFYDPILKRFIAEDPIGLAGGMNVYGYVGGDPVSRVDPSGKLSLAAVGAIAVAAGVVIATGWRPPTGYGAGAPPGGGILARRQVCPRQAFSPTRLTRLEITKVRLQTLLQFRKIRQHPLPPDGNGRVRVLQEVVKETG